MIEILKTIVVPIVTALIAYGGARYQANKDFEKAQENYRHELDKLKTKNAAEIERIEKKVEAETKAYEQSAQIDMAKSIFESKEIKEAVIKEAMKKIK